jgi:hypothetical protein
MLYLVSHSVAVLSLFTLTVYHWLTNEQEGTTRMESPVTGCARKKNKLSHATRAESSFITICFMPSPAGGRSIATQNAAYPMLGIGA